MTPLLSAIKRGMRAGILRTLWQSEDFEGRAFALESAIRQNVSAGRMDSFFCLLDGAALDLVWSRFFGAEPLRAGYVTEDFPQALAKNKSWAETQDIFRAISSAMSAHGGASERGKSPTRL